MDEMTRTNTWANVVWQIIARARKNTRKNDVWKCSLHNHRNKHVEIHEIYSPQSTVMLEIRQSIWQSTNAL